MGKLSRTEKAIRAAERKEAKLGVVPSADGVQKAGVGVKYYTIKDMAISLGVNEKTVRRWIASGKIKCAQPGGKGGAVMIPCSECPNLS